MADGQESWKGVVAAPDSKKQATMALEAKRSGSEVDISEWSSVIYFSCLTTLTKYDISGAFFLRLPSSIYPSTRFLGGPGQRGAAHTRPARTGYNTTRNPPRREVLLSLIPPLPLSSDSRTLLRDRRECLHLSPPAAYASPDASHKERFIVWRPPGARWTRREFLPRHSRVAAGDKTPTKPALLITAGVTGPHLHPGSLHRRRAFRISQREKGGKNNDAGHRMVIAVIVRRCNARKFLPRASTEATVAKNVLFSTTTDSRFLLDGWTFVHD